MNIQTSLRKRREKMEKPKSTYTYKVLEGNILYIEDQDQGKTVTNDIEAVLYEIAQHLDKSTVMEDFDIIYRDTDGIIDGVRTEDGEFKEFYAIRETNLNIAVLRVIERR